MTDIYAQLANRLGPKGYSTDAEIIAPHLVEWRGRYQGTTPFLAMPASTEEVSDLVKLCAGAGVAITPQGGNTGLVAAQIPQGEVLVSMKRMNAIRSVDPTDDSLTAEAGVVLTNVQEAARGVDRLFPLSLGSEGSATIGGLTSTNAGGVHVLRYGMMRDLVLGLEAVLPDGSVFQGLSSLRKDNTGYDLKQLFIGAEGTLGIITAVTLKLFARPRGHEVVFCAVTSPQHALGLLHRIKAATGAVSAFEIMDRCAVSLAAKNVPGVRDPMPSSPYVALIEFETAKAEGLRELIESALAEAIEAGDANDVLIAENETQARAFWAVREGAAAGHRKEGPQVNHDVSMPVSQIPTFLTRTAERIESTHPGARILAFGHMGDGNLHYTVMAPEGANDADFPRKALNDAVHETAVSLGGSISAEHGIGVARLADFNRFKSPQSIAMMRAVKAAIDPNNVMNPRAMLA